MAFNALKYRSIRDFLHENSRALRATVAHFDYELAAVQGFNSVFGGNGGICAKVCAFHAQQALLRRVQSIGLQRLHRSEKKPVMRVILMLGGLQLVREDWYADLKLLILMWVSQVVEEQGDEDGENWIPAGTKDKLKLLVEYYL
jgi:hypothetical protein